MISNLHSVPLLGAMETDQGRVQVLSHRAGEPYGDLTEQEHALRTPQPDQGLTGMPSARAPA